MAKLMITDNETFSQAEFDKKYKANYEPYGLHLNKVLILTSVFEYSYAQYSSKFFKIYFP